MEPPSRLPLGALLSALSAVICAVPTLALPADSPNAPKVALLAVGAVVFAVGVIRVRTERGAGQTDSPKGDVDNTP